MLSSQVVVWRVHIDQCLLCATLSSPAAARLCHSHRWLVVFCCLSSFHSSPPPTLFVRHPLRHLPSSLRSRRWLVVVFVVRHPSPLCYRPLLSSAACSPVVATSNIYNIISRMMFKILHVELSLLVGKSKRP